LHGLFWAAALGALALWDRSGRRAAGALALGFAAPWLAYAAYVLGGLPDWRGQTAEYAPRFGLLDPAWYLGNLANEWRRYAPGLDGPAWRILLRPGWWGTVLAWPLSVLGLARRWRDRAARTLLVPALLLPVCFALLIQSKLSNYLIALLPAGVLVIAWGGVRLWGWAGRVCAGAAGPGAQARGWLRAALAALLLAVAVEGAGRLRAGEALAHAATPYADFTARVRAEIPGEARVLGLHNYWFGLDDLDYRAWPVPLWLADPAHRSPPLALEEALDEVAPDVILLDPRMRQVFAGTADGSLHPALAWMQERGFVLRAVVDDPTYGRMDVYERAAL
jgi:hypothetical protein